MYFYWHAIVAPFLTILLLSRRIEKISGVRSYWHLFLLSIIFYVIYLVVNLGNILGIFELQPIALSTIAPLMISALSVAIGMMGLISTTNYPTRRIFLSITSLGLALPVILGLSLSYITTPSIPTPITVLILLLGFLSWCYISLSYF